VRRYAPGRNPIGLHVGDTGADSIAKYDVIGVVRDSRTVALRQTAGPMLYQPLMQDDWAGDVVLHVRVSTDPRGVAARVRDAIHGLNPHLPVYDETTLLERRAQALGGDRVMAELSSSVGFLALLLTTLGIYGVIAYTVGRRTAEIGIRMALGATSRSVRWMVVRETLALAAAGVSIGVPLALAGARGLASMLFGVGPQDPAALSGSVAMLLLVACVAGGVPASRAARLQPSTALRRE